MPPRSAKLMSAAGLAALLCSVPAVSWAQAGLGNARSFAVLGGSTVTNTGATVVIGDLGVSPGTSVTGFPPGIVLLGAIHAADAVADQAQVSATTYYNALAAAPCNVDLTGQDLGGLTLTPGVYCFDSSAQLTGTLTLDMLGNPAALFIFKIGSTLTSASNASVQLTNTGTGPGDPCGVAWQVGSSATLGTNTSFLGNLVALASITLNTGADVIGRALARGAAVTLDTNNVGFDGCAAEPPPPPPPPPVPALGTWAIVALVGLLALAGIATLRNRRSLSGQTTASD